MGRPLAPRGYRPQPPRPSSPVLVHRANGWAKDNEMEEIAIKLEDDTYESIKRVADDNGLTIEEQIERIVIQSPWYREEEKSDADNR